MRREAVEMQPRGSRAAAAESPRSREGHLPPQASFANTHAESYVFTTEGHLIPLSTAFHGPGPAPPTDEQLSAYGVLQLRELIARASLPHGDCIEKGQLRERARLAARRLEAERRSEVEARQAQDPRKLVCRTPASS
mmetsp:Transcript_13873/g.39920  ORF Transcript_13873/g.39920 Transcript_13873/m.39920 type:complete len:137 (-) Transcript_13873:214-624(-)